MSVSVQPGDFDLGAELAALTQADLNIGAVSSFIGKVRRGPSDNPLMTMELEHYPGMTESELQAIELEAVGRFGLSASRIIHRIGPLQPGDNIVLVIACAIHRQAAFDGAAFLMDYLKSRAPFWKKETRADGSTDWVEARDSDASALRRWTAG